MITISHLRLTGGRGLGKDLCFHLDSAYDRLYTLGGLKIISFKGESMVNKTNRVMVLALVSCLAFSQFSFASAPTTTATEPSVSSMITNQAAKYAWYSLLALSALMVYDLESKEGPCEDVSYDFGTLMRGTDTYSAKLKKSVAWVRRYIIGQPYKSSKMKTNKSGEIEIGKAQEPLGVMGIAQSNIKPALVGLGAAYFLNNPKSLEKLDAMGWTALLAIIFGLKQ